MGLGQLITPDPQIDQTQVQMESKNSDSQYQSTEVARAEELPKKKPARDSDTVPASSFKCYYENLETEETQERRPRVLSSNYKV